MIALLVSIFLSNAHAVDTLNYRGYSVRALGMGNAFSAIVDNSDALYYNPAALSQVKGFRLTLMDPYIGINDVSDLTDTFDNADTDNTDTFAQLLEDLYGENFWVAGGAKAGLYMTNFAIMYYAQSELSGYLTNPAYPVFDLTYKLDKGLHVGYSFEIVPNFHAGIGIRSVTRTGGTYAVGVDALEELDSETIKAALMNEGSGFGADIGLLYKSDVGIKPSLAFSWLNAGNTSFKADTAIAPSSEQQYMSVGLGAEIELPLISIRPALDVKFLDRNDIPLTKKVDFGVEINMPLITARAGFHQGYYTLGTTLDLFFLRLDAATYAEELGGYAGQIEDRRYIIQLTIELGMDADFNLFTLDSKTRHAVKQRR